MEALRLEFHLHCVVGFSVREMNENTGKTASCLAITEKRAHRPGGCIGIFFQLIDWNRRFAKKKLFSRKLLPLGSCLYLCMFVYLSCLFLFLLHCC